MKTKKKNIPSSLRSIVDRQEEFGFEVIRFDGLSISTNIGLFTLSNTDFYLDGVPLETKEIPGFVAAYNELNKPKKKKTKVKN